MLYNHVESCVRNLKSLKLDTSGYGSLLIPILKKRLPDEITMIISRKFGEQIWTLDKVMAHFNSELRAQENCVAPPLNKSVHESHRKGGYYTTSGLFGQNNKVACVYCSREGHLSSKCTSVSNRLSQKAIFCRNKRCLICLDMGHIAENCKSTYLCRKCKTSKHHISICESAPVDPPSMNREEDKNITTNDNEGFVVHASCDKSGILLQTARASILPVDDSAQVQTRILFNSGCHRSCISDKVRHAMKLKAVRVEKVVITTFGQVENSEVPELDVVQLKVQNKGDARFTFVEALCIPTICSPPTRQPLSSVHELPEFAGLNFADFEHKQD